MMQCYAELIPPSGITHAVSLPFTSATASNLVVARTSLLQIFSHKQVNHGQDTKLVLVAEYSLSGTIASLGRVKILNSKCGGEAVLVALRDAKLSLIEWNPEQHAISTISIHYYESEDLQSCPWDLDIRDCVTRLTVDPSSRCAAFNLSSGKLAILPFHQPGDDLVMDDYDSVDGDEAQTSADKETNGDMSTYHTPYDSSFVWPLTKFDPGLIHLIDLAFLHEYRQPAISVLYSTMARSSALQSERRDVTTFAAYTIDLDQKISGKLINVPRLPNDLYKAIPLSAPVLGTLLVGYNELVHVDQNERTNAVAVNEFAKQNSSFPMTDQSDCAMRLEGCQIEYLGTASGEMLIVLASGEMAILSFRIDGRSVSGISVRKMTDPIHTGLVRGRASCMATLGTGRLFIGSEEADSVLLGTARKTSQLKKNTSRANLGELSTGNGEVSAEEDSDEEDEDEDDLYSESLTQTNTTQPADISALGGGNLRILDRLSNIAPIRDIALGRPAKRRRISGASDIELTSPSELELLIASGAGRAGGVAVLSRVIKPTILQSSEAKGVNNMWSVPARKANAASQGDETKSFDEFLICSKTNASGKEESFLYTTSSGDLVERVGTEWDRSAGGTVEIGSIVGGSHTIQVLETELRVYDAGKYRGLWYTVVADSSKILDSRRYGQSLTKKLVQMQKLSALALQIRTC
jgi:cleavage and polyadenylation specificity factor subunit 1